MATLEGRNRHQHYYVEGNNDVFTVMARLVMEVMHWDTVAENSHWVMARGIKASTRGAV